LSKKMAISMSDGQPDRVAAPTSAAQVVEIAREVTGQLAPDELPVFDAVADAWLSGHQQGRPGRARGVGVGLGIDSVLLSELLFPIITGAIGQVLGMVALEQIQPRRRVRHPSRMRRPQPAPPEGTAPPGGSDDEQLDSKQVRDLRDRCEHLAAADLPPAEAAQLADVVVVTLRSGLWRSRP
jgi:hypothetical protein